MKKKKSDENLDKIYTCDSLTVYVNLRLDKKITHDSLINEGAWLFIIMRKLMSMHSLLLYLSFYQELVKLSFLCGGVYAIKKRRFVTNLAYLIIIVYLQVTVM